MKRFKSSRQLQRFVSIHHPVANLFHFRRHAFAASDYRTLRRTPRMSPMDEPVDRHIEETVRSLVEMQSSHDRKAGTLQRVANRVIASLGRPSAVAGVVIVMAAWAIGNLLSARFGAKPFEQFPFPDLAFFATTTALVVTLLILTAQRHDQALADKRAQLTLQIAMLSERKLAKIIAILEEQRRDNPMLTNRVDREVEELAQPADPLASLRRIEDTNKEPDR